MEETVIRVTIDRPTTKGFTHFRKSAPSWISIFIN